MTTPERAVAGDSDVNESNRAGRRRGAALLWLIVAVLALAAGGILLWRGRGEGPTQEKTLRWVAAREKLRISVVESGQLKAAKSVDIYCKVKGGATILELVDEGTKVKAGDILVRLDASNLENELTAQKIRKLTAEAALIQAEKAKEIQESKNQSDVDKATLDLALAKTDLEKYVEGDYLLKQKQAESDIKLAAADAETKKATAQDTRELVDLDFAAKTELDRDQLAAQQAEVKHEMSVLSSKLLDLYEKPRQLQVLKSAVEQTTAELDRVKLRCEADLFQKVADWESKKATFDLERNKLEDLERQVHNTLIRAPADGLVVFPVNQGGMGGRGGSDRDRVEEGATAREHQLLISLPDASEMVVVVSVHATSIDKLSIGLPAVVTIDALPDASFIGKVTFIAPLPDSQNQWLNPDLKVYRCEIALGGDTTMLRPGMSASVEIVVDELLDAIAVPIHAVHRRGDHYFVYADPGESRIAIRKVKIGMHNDKRVAILDGLEAGDRVYLSVPAGAPQPDFGPSETRVAETSVESLREKASAISGRPSRAENRANQEREGQERAGRGDRDGAPGAASAVDFSKFRDMSPEERQKAIEDMRARMTPEERARWDERARQFRESGGGPPAGGGAPPAGGASVPSSGGGSP